MLLTITTTHAPATDLGYLLVKHPDRVHTVTTSVGTAHVFFPAAEEHRCTAALLLEVAPEKLAGLRGGDHFALGRYVNDRPYAATSLLAVALAKAYSSALRGVSKDRPELAATAIPLEIGVPALPGHPLVERLFGPLGWDVTVRPVPLAPESWGDSRYGTVTLRGTHRLADALNHLYVLLPVLDGGKHYWVGPDEVDKLIRAGTGWLATHPDRALITDRYLAHQRAFTRTANRLLDDDPDLLDPDRPAGDQLDAPPADTPDPVVRLGERRRDAVLAALADTGASRVLDLGCGSGVLLGALAADPRYTEVVGADVSASALAAAERRLERLADRQRARITLRQTALTYADARLTGYDAAVLMEVVEHVDESRLPALARAVFGSARPGAVVVTTPNVEYNVRYPALAAGTMRHTDHRFEWTRAEFADWATRVAESYGYTVVFRPVGDEDPEVGAPTQLALFTRVEGVAA
ncbi:3' terminal RNA ribose 2'-O-methyltransferase Hen1 [Actinocatenispora rupis]|uniref:Small RNA 2'-O-methyltransferase n=1 Tax=Actinocatenispora rupis TaxID=519421 RepID=A0A8J3NE23_9ACTN|nr:3' terminal RNA ribose 2'-O-methyltransferase Hen1 [Actinocatenispora rupis]GID15889.1 3' terminal RNA ribose 2'-O-methyltransferase Hen1 [Actinocatenispora rupis]